MALLARRCPVGWDIVVTAATINVKRIGELVSVKNGDALNVETDKNASYHSTRAFISVWNLRFRSSSSASSRSAVSLAKENHIHQTRKNMSAGQHVMPRPRNTCLQKKKIDTQLRLDRLPLAPKVWIQAPRVTKRLSLPCRFGL